MTMSRHDHHKSIYSQDNPRGESSGLIQWKGTNVCIDLHCKCGHHGHVDAEFFFHYECAKCGQKYAVGHVIKLIPLTQEQVDYCEANFNGFIKGEGDIATTDKETSNPIVLSGYSLDYWLDLPNEVGWHWKATRYNDGGEVAIIFVDHLMLRQYREIGDFRGNGVQIKYLPIRPPGNPLFN